MIQRASRYSTAFRTILGAAGLAVGLVLQGTPANCDAGVMLILFEPFRAGDMIEAAGSFPAVFFA